MDNIVLIEDNPADARFIELTLVGSDFTDFKMEVFDTLKAGMEKLAKGNVSLLLLDLNMPDSKGLDTFNTVAAGNFNIPIVVLTGINDKKLAFECVRRGAEDYMEKADITSKSLSRCILYAIERHAHLSALKDMLQGVKKTLEATLLHANEIIKK